MVRDSLRLVALAACVPGCSLILDFSDSAGVHDASIDGPYTADQCAYKEPNDTPDTAAVITVADTGPAAICKVTTDGGIGRDLDYYKFTVPDGTTKVTLTLTDAPGAGDLDLVLYDATGGTMLGQSRNFGLTETLVCPGSVPACAALTAGDYIFEVLSGPPTDLDNYTFSLAFEP